MSWSRFPWSAVPWSGTDGNEPPPGQVLPPPVPGGTTVYYTADETGVYPWSMRGWSGARTPTAYLPGGVVVTPDPVHGVMRVLAWWPYADGLTVVRIDADGNREPVRGAYGASTVRAGATRVNYCTNPSFEAGINGVVPNDANTTATSVTDSTAPAGTHILRVAITAAGSIGVTVPAASTGQQPVTIGLDARLSATPSALRVVVSWNDASGGALSTTTVTVPSVQVIMAVGQWARLRATLTPPDTALTPTVKIFADGMPAAGKMDLDGITVETAPNFTDGGRFDGESLGGSWTGAQHLSTSVLAPIVQIADGEAPLDEPVSYLVADYSLTGGTATSPQVVLDSGNRSWLTHPSSPGTPVRVGLREKPVLTYPIPRGVFRPIGRPRAVAVTAARQAPDGTLDFNALSREERVQLRAMLADGQPVLLRAPGDYDWDVRWVSLGDADHDPEGRLGWQDAWLISAPFTEVDAPTLFA